MGLSSFQDFKTKKFWTAVIAEFIGSAILVLVGCGSCLAHSDPDINAKVTRISLCFGLSVGTIVWAICNVSGGHINPAVTFGFFVTRQLTVVRFFLYVIFQTLGAVAGAAILKAVTPSSIAGSLGTPGTSIGASMGQVFGAELLVTFVFVFTVLASCDGQRTDLKGSIPLAVGLAIAMCHLWAVPYSGSGMNPARSFGPALVSNSWTNHWAYWAGPLVGGALGAWLYDFVFAVNATTSKFKGYFTRDYDNNDYTSQGRREQTTANENEAVPLKDKEDP